MFRVIRKGTLAVALTSVAWGSLAALGAPVTNSDKSVPTPYKPEQIIVLKEPGKGDRKCLIIATTPQADGGLAYKVKALDNGEIMTIYDRPIKDLPVGPPPTTGKTATSTAMTTDTVLPPPLLKTDKATIKTEPTKTSTIQSQPPAKLTAMVTDASKAPTPPPPRGWFSRVFGPSTPPATDKTTPSSSPMLATATCAACAKGNTVTTTTVKPNSVIMPASPTTKPTTPIVLPQTTVRPQPVTPTTTPTVVDKVSLNLPAPEPLVTPPLTLPEKGATSSTPAALPETVMKPVGPLPKFNPPAEIDSEEWKITQAKVALKAALRPSEREIAAEQLLSSSRGTTPEVRAMVLIAAQEDPAPTVRLSCLHTLAKQGIKDQALMSLLVAAQQDKDARVREQANVELAHLSMKK